VTALFELSPPDANDALFSPWHSPPAVFCRAPLESLQTRDRGRGRRERQKVETVGIRQVSPVPIAGAAARTKKAAISATEAMLRIFPKGVSRRNEQFGKISTSLKFASVLLCEKSEMSSLAEASGSLSLSPA
jgi:hypothetical protein